jgi:hypothetical protein
LVGRNHDKDTFSIPGKLGIGYQCGSVSQSFPGQGAPPEYQEEVKPWKVASWYHEIEIKSNRDARALPIEFHTLAEV